MTTLYVRVLDGRGRRKIHSPDCAWVAGSTEKPPSTPRKRRYELLPASSVSGAPCRWCGVVPGPVPTGEAVTPSPA